MSNNLNQAMLFFDACETGKGWDGCREYCHPDASFSAQSGVLSEINTLEGYSEWMNNLLTPVPGGPGEPTGRTVAADYVYAMEFDGDGIKHMTKIWNDTVSLQQLGWA